MGLAGYFRKFIPEFATGTACVTKLTRENEPFVWTEEKETARKYIIDHLTSKTLLSVFNPELPTQLHTDASSLGYGAVLLQKSDGNLKVIGYFSKKTNRCEEKYSYKMETLAVVIALKYFRIYLLGIQVTLVTDCNAVKSIATKKDIAKSSQMVGIHARLHYIVHRKGFALPHADFLSRNPMVVRRLISHENWLYVEQRGNAEVKNLISDWREGHLDKTRNAVKNDILHYVVSTSDGKYYKTFCSSPK